jgi:hypothetical protein
MVKIIFPKLETQALPMYDSTLVVKQLMCLILRSYLATMGVIQTLSKYGLGYMR